MPPSKISVNGSFEYVSARETFSSRRSSDSNQRTPSPTMDFPVPAEVSSTTMVATPRIFVGIINKKNTEDMEILARELFRRCRFEEYGAILVHSHGFYVDLRADAVEEALDKLDGAPLHEAVNGSVTARIVLRDEKDTAIIERLNCEIWIRPRADRDVDKELSDLVEVYQDWGLVANNPSHGDPEADKIFQPTAKSRWDALSPKYVVGMVSSEAVMVASGEYGIQHLPRKFREVFAIQASPACEYRHRYDRFSVVLQLPKNWRTTFDEDKFVEWRGRLAKGGLHFEKYREKVKSPRSRQVFTDNDRQRNTLTELIPKLCGDYMGYVPVAVLNWESFILYDFIAILSKAEQEELRGLMDGSKETIARCQKLFLIMDDQSKRDAVADWDGDEEYENLDTYYHEIYNAPKEVIPIDVWRDKNDPNLRHHYYDVFVATREYDQSCLKKTATVAKFWPQLNTLIGKSGAKNGLILNDYLSFGSLDGIVFYLYFDNLAAARRCREMVRRREWRFKNVIQQQEGINIATNAVPGVGFDVVFRDNEFEKQIFLRDVARKRVTEYQIS